MCGAERNMVSGRNEDSVIAVALLELLRNPQDSHSWGVEFLSCNT